MINMYCYYNIETRQNRILSATAVAMRFVFAKSPFLLKYGVKKSLQANFFTCIITSKRDNVFVVNRK